MEFAIVAPVFILLVFGLIEYGRMVMVQQVLTNASREGARQAVLDGATTEDVETVVNEYMTDAAVSEGDVIVTPDPPSSASFGEPVSVEVSVNFDDVSWLPGSWFGSGAIMSARSVMRRESAN